MLYFKWDDLVYSSKLGLLFKFDSNSLDYLRALSGSYSKPTAAQGLHFVCSLAKPLTANIFIFRCWPRRSLQIKISSCRGVTDQDIVLQRGYRSRYRPAEGGYRLRYRPAEGVTDQDIVLQRGYRSRYHPAERLPIKISSCRGITDQDIVLQRGYRSRYRPVEGVTD